MIFLSKEITSLMFEHQKEKKSVTQLDLEPQKSFNTKNHFKLLNLGSNPSKAVPELVIV